MSVSSVAHKDSCSTMISWRVSRSTEEAFSFVNMRSTITVKAQGGVDEPSNMGSRNYQANRQ